MKHPYRTALLIWSLALMTTLATVGGTALGSSSMLSVPDAVELALQRNIALQIAKINNENAQISYEKAMVSPTPVARQSAELSWEKAQVALTTAKTDVVIGALGSYLSLQNTLLDLKIREKQAEAALRAWEKTKILVQKGTASALDELQAELAGLSALNSLEAGYDSYDESATAYAHMLGLEKLPDLSADNVLAVPAFDVQLSEALEAALRGVTVREKEVALEQALIQRAADEAGELSRADDTVSRNNVKLAELSLAKAKSDAIESITGAFNGVKQAKKGLEVAEGNLDVEQKRFDIVRKQYDSGLKTASDLDNAEIALLRADKDLRTAQRAYVMAWLSFQKALGNEIDLSGVVKPNESK